jgi:hypothetical protein
MNSYRIEHVRDFQQVPPDRVDDCLKEFAVFIEMARLSSLIGGDDVRVGAFTWHDDGERNITVKIQVQEIK